MAGCCAILEFVTDLATIHVRNAREEDAEELASLFHESVREVAAQHYSDAQVRAWSPSEPDPERFVMRITDGRTFLVATGLDDEILAYGDLEANGHIDHLYARPDAAGTGVARLVYDRLEQAAHESGIERLFVEASEPASRFFTKRGFEIVERNDFELGGVPIHNFRMEKLLNR
jgi:putative acetyltransferase